MTPPHPTPQAGLLRAIADGKQMQGRLTEDGCDWQPIETAPKDRPILAWCDHEADPYFEEDSGRLTPYGGHAEGASHAPTGYHIVEWGWCLRSSWEGGGAHMPDWWFVVGSDFECAANPTHWMPLPVPPIKEES